MRPVHHVDELAPGLYHYDPERHGLQLLVDGMTMRQIADQLFVSYYTIDTHIRNIYAKLHVRTRGGAVASRANQAKFLRRFLALAEREGYTYYIMEAFDQVWKK